MADSQDLYELLDRIGKALERIADLQAETREELRRINAGLREMPVSVRADAYSAGIAIRTTDNDQRWRILGHHEVIPAPHRSDCTCPKCKEARFEAAADAIKDGGIMPPRQDCDCDKCREVRAKAAAADAIKSINAMLAD